ncbi:MAG TPA: methionine synthase [Candidatus Hydrogenedentes bacterium]|nr:methionine synthase [Candidatus Hydrogenedentota bacterium]HIJ73018.1 methionine synthase [Candidatus Hydrogenedentota bacterium]
MNTISDTLKAKSVLISDGAWGTFLAAKGLRAGECPELWNVDRPDDVLDVARSYVEAGADMIMTNSFGGSRFKLEHFGLAARAAELNEAAAAISRRAAGPDRHVLASIGPTGKILMTGEVSEKALYEAFGEQAAALEKGGADACVVETMAAIDEACLAIRAARDRTDLDVLCTFTFNALPDGSYRTMMGVSPSETVSAALDAGAAIVGTNCGQGPAGMVGIVREMRAAAGPDVPIIVQPNAGLPKLEDGKNVFPETPEGMAKYVPDLIDAGANILGGCCGTGPDHIRAIAAAARNATGLSL